MYTEPELSELEMSLHVLLDSKCPVPKQMAIEHTERWFHHAHFWGFLVFNFSCVLVADFDEIFGSESISFVVFRLLALLHACPGLSQRLRVLAYDDACHLLLKVSEDSTRRPTV